MGTLPSPGNASLCPGRAAPRYRHDGFTPEKKRIFLDAMGQCGCLTDAARIAGVSRNTVGRHRRKWPDFAAACNAARERAAASLEAVAWRRAVEGAEEKVYKEGVLVMVRVKPSDAMLRLLLQANDPERFGRLFGGESPQAMEKRLRAKIAREAEAAAAAAGAEADAARAEIEAEAERARDELDALLSDLNRRMGGTG